MIKGNNYIDKDTKEIQKALLDSWKYLKKIIDSNNIRYYAIGGTAIGAFREEGFIPWDDDMDIAVIEEDHRKLIDLIREDERLSLENIGMGQVKSMLKIFDKKHKINVASAQNDRLLFIDVMIYGNKKKISKWWIIKDQILRFATDVKQVVYQEKAGQEGKFVAVGYVILKWLIPFTKKFFEWRAIKNREKLVDDSNNINKNGDECWWLSHINYNEWYKKGKIIEIPFEDSSVKVLENWPESVIETFGDIFVVPEEKALTKHLFKMKK